MRQAAVMACGIGLCFGYDIRPVLGVGSNRGMCKVAGGLGTGAGEERRVTGADSTAPDAAPVKNRTQQRRCLVSTNQFE